MTQAGVAEDSKKLIFRARLVDEQRWKQRAKAEGLTFSEWARRTLNAALADGAARPAGWRPVRVPLAERRLHTELTNGGGACSAYVEHGMRCRLCGKVHNP